MTWEELVQLDLLELHFVREWHWLLINDNAQDARSDFLWHLRYGLNLSSECAWVDEVSSMTWLHVTVEHEAMSHPEVVHVIDGITKPVERMKSMKDVILTIWHLLWDSWWLDPSIGLPWHELWLTEDTVVSIISLTDIEQCLEVFLKELERFNEVSDVRWMIVPLLWLICHLRLDESLEQMLLPWMLRIDSDELHDTLKLMILLSWLHCAECMTDNLSLNIIVELFMLDMSNCHALNWLGNWCCRFADCCRCCGLLSFCHSWYEGSNWGWQLMQHLRAGWLCWVWDGCQTRWLRWWWIEWHETNYNENTYSK